MANASTDVNTGLLHHHVSQQFGLPGSIEWNDGHRSKVADTARSLFGDSIKISDRQGLSDIDAVHGTPHSLTGIPYAINGTATVINQKMSAWLSEFQDPVHAILGTAFHSTRSIIVIRESYIGGDATVIPERGSGKTIARKEEQRKIITVRLGNDFAMNLNLFLLPSKAKEELDNYVNYQRLNLQRTIVRMAWEAIFREGVRIEAALAKTDTLMSLKTSDLSKLLYLDRMYAQGVALAIPKHRFGLSNLLSTIARLNVYTPSGPSRSGYELMVVPLGFNEFDKTTPDRMFHYISGLPQYQGMPVKMPMSEGVYKMGNLKVMQYTPIADFRDSGTANSSVISSPMEEILTVGMHYIERRPEEIGAVHPCVVTNFETGAWTKLPQLTGTDLKDSVYGKADPKKYYWWARPALTIKTENLVLVADPGPNTGEIVIQWPKLDIMTQGGPESLRGKLRVYSNSYLKYPENVLIVNSAKCKGYISGGGSKTIRPGGDYVEEAVDLVPFCTDKSPENPEELLRDRTFQRQCEDYGMYLDFYGRGASAASRTTQQLQSIMPVVMYPGTLAHPDGKIRVRNSGHLGVIDHPNNTGVLNGFQVFAAPWSEFGASEAGPV